MAVFAYIYHQSFVIPQSVSVEMILDQVLSLHFQDNYFILLHKCTYEFESLTVFMYQILMNLTVEEQQAIYTKLGQILKDRLMG